jgi:hypothetical protein
MEQDTITTYLALSAILGMILIPLIFAYDDGIRFALPKRLFCKLGFHKMKKRRVHKYYCQYCKKPRKHPELKMLDGGNKIRDNQYKL